MKVAFGSGVIFFANSLGLGVKEPRAPDLRGWNITRSAKDVGMQRSNFQALMRKYKIKIEK